MSISHIGRPSADPRFSGALRRDGALELEPIGPDLHAEDKKDSVFDRAERDQVGPGRRERLDVQLKRNLDHIRFKDKELQNLIESFRKS